jgi:hypothetical protein
MRHRRPFWYLPPGRGSGVRCPRRAVRDITSSSSPSRPSGPIPNPRVMNKYAHMAISHWQKTDPDRYQQIPDSEREQFFSELGERAETEIQQLQSALAGPDPVGESYLEKLGRLNMARLQAEERVLADLILIPGPETSEEDDLADEQGRRQLEYEREMTRLHQETD